LGTSAGLIWGYDLSPLRSGGVPKQTFRFYTAGDNDPSVVIDEDGMLYVAGEFDRDLPRAREVGQLMKLDPSNRVNPVVWSFTETTNVASGIYGTPAIAGGTIIVTTDGGRLIGLDRATGAVQWERRLPGPLWASPVIVDDVLLVGDCSGFFHAFDVANPAVAPSELWSIELGSCIEATPAVWDGRIYIGTRGGHLYVLGDPSLAATPSTPAPRVTTTSTTR